MRIYVLSTQTLMSTKLDVPNKNIHDRPKQILRPEELAYLKKLWHLHLIRFLLVYYNTREIELRVQEDVELRDDSIFMDVKIIF